jgi:hypothetical protein
MTNMAITIAGSKSGRQGRCGNTTVKKQQNLSADRDVQRPCSAHALSMKVSQALSPFHRKIVPTTSATDGRLISPVTSQPRCSEQQAL